MSKCPKCRKPGQAVIGYIIVAGRIVRCDVCLGWGVTTDHRIFQWELSL